VAATRHFDPVDWKGHWIGPEPLVEATSDDAAADATPVAGGFSRVFFRREVELAAVPTIAPLRLTADSRYVIWVNGHEVGRGPVRSQPRRWHYDEYDIAPFLVAGVNAIAILVTYYGSANSFWQPAVPAGGMGWGRFGGDALLAVEGRLGDIELLSDASWRARRSTAWTVPAASHHHEAGVPVEVLDARELPSGWMGQGFDDGGWARAAILKPVMMGVTRSRPPTTPYGRLRPRPIGALGGDTVEATAVLDVSVRPRPEWTSEHPADRVLQVIHDGPALDAGGTFPATASPASDEVLHVGVDFGRIVAGYVELDVDAPAGTVVELLYRERALTQGHTPFNDARTAARYVVAGPGSRYAAVEVSGLRHLHAVVHGAGTGEVTIHRVAVREYLYAHVGGAYFRSDDPELDALYRAGIRTVRLNSFDSFTDCPTREQRAWVGDAVVHQMVHLTTNEDWRLARYYAELSDSPRADGMLPMSVAGDMEGGGGTTIPDWALHWVHGVHNLYRYTGDREGVVRHLPTVERVLRWYTSYLDDHGTLSDVAEWNLIDWSSVFTTGRSSIVTALWARGLRELAEMSDWLGNAGTAAWARRLHEEAKAGFEDFWDSSRGVYVDHFVEGVRQPAASQAANASAIVSGLAPTERWGAIADTMTDPAKVVVSSWIGGYEHGDISRERWDEQMRGIQDIGWDAAREIVRAEPFFSYVVHDALAAAGRHERLLEVMRDWSSFLVDGYDSFGECWGWGTPVHGWASTPTRDLVTYILGVTPAEPGYAAVRVAPRLGVLREAAGAVPTPHGLVEVRVRDGEVDVTSPVPVVLVSRDGTETRFPGGGIRAAI
jgi:hypothetical protein